MLAKAPPKHKCIYLVCGKDVVYYYYMLQLSGMITNCPVLSLRTGTPVGVVLGPIINPNNLKVEGFYCHDDASRKQLILVSQDIRDILPQGVVVNDQDVLVEPEELVRLKDVMTVNFDLVGKQVITTDKTKLGKVSDYAVETTSMYIQKLYVSQSLFKSFSGGNLGIDRSQIIEITDKRIVVHDLRQKVPAHAGVVPA
jgi:sporulation protein YlmC with PRC-barrel domain